MKQHTSHQRRRKAMSYIMLQHAHQLIVKLSTIKLYIDARNQWVETSPCL
jgi:hypothetical protein